MVDNIDNENENENEKSSEDYLKDYLNSTSMGSSVTNDDNLNKVKVEVDNSNNRTSDLQFFSFPASDLPLGIFYPANTTIMVRAALVKEIQAYSMIDESNLYDVTEKMNDMLSSCVRVKYANGKVSSYLDLKDGDRYYIIFLIRELTFQKGNVLNAKATCPCDEERKVDIPLIRANFVFHEMNSGLEPYFDINEKKFILTSINNTVFKVGAPSIGLQKSFMEKIVNDYKNKVKPNLSFLKIIPFIISDMNNASVEFIETKLKEFQEMDLVDFGYLNSAIDKMIFGISELKTTCSECGQEVRTPMQFPNGFKGIFIDDDAFTKYNKK